MNAPRSQTEPHAGDSPNGNSPSFLPDFCNSRTALAIILIVELVAIVIALGNSSTLSNFWTELAAASMFLLWVGLGCAMALCRVRPHIESKTTQLVATLSLSLIVAVVVIVSECTFQLGQYFSGGIPTQLYFPDRHLEFVLRNAIIGLIVGGLALRYFYVANEWRRSIELEAQARVHALHARIRPHFLFNSMNTIAALTRRDPRKAEEAVQDLADLFRANLNDARKNISLEEEIEVAQVYQRIETLRLGERLNVTWRLDNVPLDAQVPSLLLQPLLENAIYHGIERLPAGGEVTIDGDYRDGMIELRVANPTISRTIALSTTGAHRLVHRGHKLALDNIRQRLQLAWPESLRRAEVHTDDRDGEYIVTLRFPYSRVGAIPSRLN
jgi:two-component system, LytTR family, sensor histidine kinase AlgZ